MFGAHRRLGGMVVIAMGLLRTIGRKNRPFALAAACLAGMALPGQAETLEAHYAVSLLGLRIGDLSASGALQPQNYRMDINARVSGLATLVSDVQMALAR
jgi:hypothetical protein